MKGGIVFLLLLAAIVVASMLHVNKSNDRGDRVEKLSAGLKEVKDNLPLNSSVTLKMPPGALTSDAYALWLYILAPRYCSINYREKFDTVLTICNRDISDSVIHSITDNRKTICSSSDGQYKYYVTCNNK